MLLNGAEMPLHMVRLHPIAVMKNAEKLTGLCIKDWTLDKGDILNTNSSGGELGMLLTETNGGTRLSSTRYVHYGNITAQGEHLCSFLAVLLADFVLQSRPADGQVLSLRSSP